MSDEKSGRKAAELAALVGGRIVGDENTTVRGVASLQSANETDITFVDDEKLLETAAQTRAACVIVPDGSRLDGHGCLIEVAHPKLAFAIIADLLNPSRRRDATVHATACVAPSASIGAGVYIGPGVTVDELAKIGDGTQLLAGVTVGEGVTIGRGCVIHPSAVLYTGVTLGNHVILHAGVVIGADGFGYVRDAEGEYHKFPQVGSVVIEDDVEIGANSCVDRGALGDTRIGRGTKIDNLVQIAHNVQVGERVVIAAQTGISGSTVIESDVVIGGQVGMGDHARVQSGAVIGSQAGVLPGKIVRSGVWWGTPVQPLDEYKRLNALWGRLPQMRAELKELRRRIRMLEKDESESWP